MTTDVLKRPLTLGEFRAMNKHTYWEKNKAFSDAFLVARVLQVAALLLELAAKDYRDEFPRQLADLFSWYNALANRLELDVQKIFWQKYPGVCSYCFRPENCICQIEHPSESPEKAIRLRGFRIDREGREPLTLAAWQEFNGRLYAWQHEREIPLITAAKIVEEAAEVSEAFHHNDMESVANEMADVLSRLLTFATRMKIDLADAMWYFYPYACRKCEEEFCVCEEMV